MPVEFDNTCSGLLSLRLASWPRRLLMRPVHLLTEADVS